MRRKKAPCKESTESNNKNWPDVLTALSQQKRCQRRDQTGESQGCAYEHETSRTHSSLRADVIAHKGILGRRNNEAELHASDVAVLKESESS